MKDTRQRPAEIEIDEIREGVHDRQVRDHFPGDPRLGMRAEQPVLGSHKWGGKEAQAEAKTLLPHSSPGRLAADARSELVTERGVIDQVVQASADRPKDVRAQARPPLDRRLYLFL